MKKIFLLPLLCGVFSLAQAQAPADPAAAEKQALLAQRMQAEQLRREASIIRDDAETQRAKDEQACHHEILVNACRDAMRERYIDRVTVARNKEIEANRLDSLAKARQTQLREAERLAGQSAPAPGKSARSTTVRPPRGEPPAPVSAEKLAAAQAAKRQHLAEIAADRARNDAEARKRAAAAKENAARYAARAKEVAEKKAKREAKKQAQGNPPAQQSTPAASR